MIPNPKMTPGIRRIALFCIIFGTLTSKTGLSGVASLFIIVSALGLMFLKNWGRVLFLWTVGFIVVSGLLDLLSGDTVSQVRAICEKSPQLNPAYIVPIFISARLAFLGLFGFAFFYMMRPNVKMVFKPQNGSGEPSTSTDAAQSQG